MHASFKLMNLRESIWKELYRKIMVIALLERRFNSGSHCNVVHNFIPMLQAVQIPGCRSRCREIMKEARKTASMANDQGKGQKRGRSGSTKKSEEQSTLPH